MRALHDGHGRSVRYLRLSVTDRCNLRCLYCRSNAKQRCIPHEQVLRYEEMARMVGIAASLGIGKVRLTGGEPFARKGCGQFLAMLHARFPDMDLRVTTNGTLLEPHIPLLRRIGVSAVNLSLDSFDRETFARVTGRDLLPPVLAALDGLLAAGVRGGHAGRQRRADGRFCARGPDHAPGSALHRIHAHGQRHALEPGKFLVR